MKIEELRDKSILILGLGAEGRSTLRFLRATFPDKTLGVADQHSLELLSPDARILIEHDVHLRRHLGGDYLANLSAYDIIVKSPGISVKLPEYRAALATGKPITSQTAIFFANSPGTIFGVTGTKGKSTTASLLHAMLVRQFASARLIGNIGIPPLDELRNNQTVQEKRDAPIFSFELSSHQLEGLRQSPHVAILLNIVPEHLDYYESFADYVNAKENITRYQSEDDWLIYDADHELPRQIAARSRARKMVCSLNGPPVDPLAPGCFLRRESLVYRSGSGGEELLASAADVRLPGRFNLINVLAAAAAARLAGVPGAAITAALHEFQPLEHRLEPVGEFGGVRYYNDSIATVPDATIAALDTLGSDVETLLLGGADRGLDFSALAKRILASAVKTVILFPPSGVRISEDIAAQKTHVAAMPQLFPVKTMEEALAVAQQHTSAGKICLHSPASPSFGLFRDYRDRGEQFKRLVRDSTAETQKNSTSK